MHCLTAVKSDLGMILSIYSYVGLLVRIFSSFKFPFMYSDMQVHKYSRLLTFFCDVPFKLGKITLMIKGREHKSSMSLSEMNSSLGFSEYLLKSCYSVLSDSTCRITWFIDILSQKKCMPPIVPQE